MLKIDNIVVGSKIKKFRKAKKLTQRELANLIGKSEITIRKYESGDIQVPNDVLHAIANSLDISVINLMDLSEAEGVIKKDGIFIEYLESLGYNFNFEKELLENKESYSVTISNGTNTVTLVEVEFEEFKSTIEKSIEFEIYKISKRK